MNGIEKDGEQFFLGNLYGADVILSGHKISEEKKKLVEHQYPELHVYEIGYGLSMNGAMLRRDAAETFVYTVYSLTPWLIPADNCDFEERWDYPTITLEDYLGYSTELKDFDMEIDLEGFYGKEAV